MEGREDEVDGLGWDGWEGDKHGIGRVDGRCGMRDWGGGIARHGTWG